MKYVYVLSSSEKDYYYEELLISAYSLRAQMRRAEIIVVTDDKTYDTLCGTREEIKRIVTQIIVKWYDSAISSKVRSRLMKTSLRSIIDGDFIFIDTDTVIVADLAELDSIDCDLAFVLDKHIHLSDYYAKEYHSYNAKVAGYRPAYKDCHYNSGVALVRDTPLVRKFYSTWNNLYLEGLKKGVDTDQCSLNETNCRFDGLIQELDGIWNVQLDTGMRYIHEGKIFHYLGYRPTHKEKKYKNTLPFLLCDSTYFDYVKCTGRLNADIISILNHPKSAFKDVQIIPEDCITYDIIASNHMKISKFMYVNSPLWQLVERMLEQLFKRRYK